MAKINLLPWREELRAQQKRDFIAAIGAGVVFTLIIFAGVHLYIESLKSYQDRRNKILEDEIAILNKKIKQIDSIEEQKTKLMNKIELIQRLQESRPEAVHLFDELARVTPDGVYLTKFTQVGADLTFEGKSQSNARVSAFMRAIDASSWLKTPKLSVIQISPRADVIRLSDFTLLAKLGNKNAPDPSSIDDSANDKKKPKRGKK